MTDTIARTKAYQDAEVILVRDSSHIPLYHRQFFFVIKPNVQGVYHRPILGIQPWFKYVSITK
jgi:ABC-type oligopeptide transport system substrate-binding subunit